MAVIRKESKQIREVSSFNVNLSCAIDPAKNRIACERCEKFFGCGDERKWQIYSEGRLKLARERMAKIKYKIAIVGGKGGVGKTMFTVNLAMGLAMRKYKVAILDSDYDGSSVPVMLGVTDKKLVIGENGAIDPVVGPEGIKIVSMGNLGKQGEIVTWYSDTRRGATEEFITHVNYGECDFLIVDLPPGTSADTVNSMLFIPDMTGVVFITVPSEVSQDVASRAANLCQTAKVQGLGIIENMSGYVCRSCHHRSELYASGGGDKLSRDTGVPLIGRLPVDGYIGRACDEGNPFVRTYPESPGAKTMEEIIDRLLESIQNTSRDLSHLDQKAKGLSWW